MLSVEQLQMRLPTHVSRVHTQLIRISVSLGSDKLNVTASRVLNMWAGLCQGVDVELVYRFFNDMEKKANDS